MLRQLKYKKLQVCFFSPFPPPIEIFQNKNTYTFLLEEGRSYLEMFIKIQGFCEEKNSIGTQGSILLVFLLRNPGCESSCEWPGLSLYLGLVQFTHGTSQVDVKGSAVHWYSQDTPQNLAGRKAIPHLLFSVSSRKWRFRFICCSPEYRLKSYLSENALTLSKWAVSGETAGFWWPFSEKITLLLLGAVCYCVDFSGLGLELLNFY